ncbi:MAG TPA: alpha/beta hydrolase fold domain-containing protein [Thermoanaerobaculia bacterium]|nr:alpha/beta hydrolase fold domain-containing protein [Thermoanaerobaculia bacterium]
MRAVLILLLLVTTVTAAEPEHDPGDGGLARDAFLNFPSGVAIDRSGNLYVTERGGNRLRRIDATTGVITSIVTDLNQPTGVLVDRDGTLIVSDTFNYQILRIDPADGRKTVVAGTGKPGFGGDGGPATEAQITAPFGLALDARGNLFFTDTEVHRIRRIDRRTGIVTTVAGNGEWGFSGDGGPAVAARLARPHQIVFDPRGDLIIADSFNQRIRRVNMRSGAIETIAGAGLRGSSGDGGPARDATLCYMGDLVFDRRGDLVISGVCDSRIRRIDMRTGIISAFAGGTGTEFAGEGLPFLESSFATPAGMAVGRRGIYVADLRAHRLLHLDERSGTVTTIAGGKAPRNPVIRWRFLYDREQFVRDQSGSAALIVPGVESVAVRQDIVYAGDDALRRFDLYRPPRPGALPAVVLVSGRNDTEIVPDTWGIFESRARNIASAGYAAIMFNHRLGLNGTFVDAAADLDRLLQHLQRNASDLGIDPSRIALVSWSMGSTLLPDVLRSGRPGVKAVALFYPWADLRELQNWQAPGRTAENAEEYSIVSSLPENSSVPPLLVVRAGKDAPLTNKGIDTLIAEALRRDLSVHVVNVPGQEVEFDRRDETILRTVVDFFRRHL